MKKMNVPMLQKIRQLTPTKLAVITSLGALIGLIQAILAVTLFIPTIFPLYNKALKQQFHLIALSLKFIHAYSAPRALGSYLHHIFTILTLISCICIIDYSKVGHKLDTVGNHTLAFLNILLIILQINAGISFEVCIPTIAFTVVLIIRLILVNQSRNPSKNSTTMKTRSSTKRKTTTPKKYVR